MRKETNERQSLHGPAGPRGGGGGVAMHSHFTQIKSGQSLQEFQNPLQYIQTVNLGILTLETRKDIHGTYMT